MIIRTDDQNTDNTQLRPYRILSLDGGGMRGVYQATYLATFAERIARSFEREIKDFDLGRAFDMVVGTSTGGLVACALFSGAQLSQVRTLYYDYGSKIFPYQGLRALPFMRKLIVPLGIGTKSGAKVLEDALFSLFGNQTIGEIHAERDIALCIPAVNLQRHSSVVFKTAHLRRSSDRDGTRRLVDVCLATTAAPLFRAPAVIPETTLGDVTSVYTDGGLWANNPAFIGLYDGMEVLREASQSRPVQVFMLGTLPSQGGEFFKSANRYRHACAWGLGAKVILVSMNAQAVGHDYIVKAAASHREDGSFAYRLPAQCPSLELQKHLDNMDDARKLTLDYISNQAINDVDYAWAQVSRENSESPLRAFKDAIESVVLQ